MISRKERRLVLDREVEALNTRDRFEVDGSVEIVPDQPAHRLRTECGGAGAPLPYR
jgi:hypothetical protein